MQKFSAFANIYIFFTIFIVISWQFSAKLVLSQQEVSDLLHKFESNLSLVLVAVNMHTFDRRTMLFPCRKRKDKDACDRRLRPKDFGHKQRGPDRDQRTAEI